MFNPDQHMIFDPLPQIGRFIFKNLTDGYMIFFPGRICRRSNPQKTFADTVQKPVFYSFPETGYLHRPEKSESCISCFCFPLHTVSEECFLIIPLHQTVSASSRADTGHAPPDPTERQDMPEIPQSSCYPRPVHRYSPDRKNLPEGSPGCL